MHKLILFYKLVAPILNYSVEMWGLCSADKIEIIHLQFANAYYVLRNIDKRIWFMVDKVGLLFKIGII